MKLQLTTFILSIMFVTGTVFVSEQITLVVLIFAGIYFRESKKLSFAGINFRELKKFWFSASINFRELVIFRIFAVADFK